MTRQFKSVNCQYGAPIGRSAYGIPENLDPRSVRVFRVRLDAGGYDDGGAYWGHYQSLYCATDNGDYRQFIRACSRAEAIAKLEIPSECLKRSTP